ncbi:hypothetical protein [Streptomyces sp. enrichment culture]|uniref:hypothetical protein n=1 Tax=Streptomyces sp. enrichment culture TaxID=1795815 RepID=UPI003F5707A5
MPDPFGERPLLTPAMTAGYVVVPEDERHRLRSYLEAVVAVRPAPVHAAVAFNAVYFGYDLDGDGYGGSPLSSDAFPVVKVGESTPVLPVGAMVCIATGSDPLFAEIVYKEGAHPELGPLGEVPAWVSGAPAGAEGPGRPTDATAPRRRERLVPDVNAFGPRLSLSPAQLLRLRTRRRWIDEDGHLVIDVRHSSPEAVRCDDLTAYAEHLLTTARDQLLNPYVPVSLAELVSSTRDDDLRTGLVGLLDTVRGVLHSSPALRTWGHYAMTRDRLAAGLHDSGPLGGDDLKSLVAAVEHAATPAKRRFGLTSAVTEYTAVGPRLRTFPGAPDALRGVDYAAAVFRANLALADAVRGDSDRGLFENGARITLDDAFEGGGIWRSHHPGAAEPASDPLVPAGRGWTSSLAPAQSQGPEEEPEPEEGVEPTDQPLADGPDLGRGELLRDDAHVVVWRAPLRLAHLRSGWFPLHPEAVRELRRSLGVVAGIRLELDHPGGEVAADSAVQEVTAVPEGDGVRLAGITWPQDFYPGLMLDLRLPRGGAVIWLATTELDEPLRFGDRVTGHCFDPRVVTREDAPGSGRGGDTAVGLGPRALVLRTVRRCGLLTPDGHALQDRAALPRAAYGRRPARVQVAALMAAVAELFEERVLEPTVGSRDVWGQPHFPPRAGQPAIPLIAYRPTRQRVIRPWGGADEGGDKLRVLHVVPGHLRRLRPGCSPSDVQRAAFRDYCRRLGKADGWELPPGYTFVTEHTRGH